MTSVNKQKVKALKGPDEFQVRVLKILDWMNRHVKYLVLIALPVVATVVGIYIWQNVKDHMRDGRLDELGAIQVLFEGEEKTAEKQRAALREQMVTIDAEIAKQMTPATPTTSAPNQPAVAEPKVADPALTAKKEALQKQVDAIKADHSGSLQGFQAFFAKHSTHPEGWLAGTTATKILTDQKKLPEARAQLEKVLAASKGDNLYQVQARFLLIGLLEEQGEFDLALQEAAALDKLGDAELKPRVLLTQGRLQMLKQADAEARKTFAALIEKHPASTEAQKARSLQALLK